MENWPPLPYINAILLLASGRNLLAWINHFHPHARLNPSLAMMPTGLLQNLLCPFPTPVPLPLAILMSRAVRISAIRVEVKWTVMSSATGMFISTSLCARERRKQRTENNIEKHIDQAGGK